MEPKFPTLEAYKESEGSQERCDRLEALLDEALLDDALSRRDFFEAVRSTEYESAKETYEKLLAVNAYRKQATQSQAREFYSLVEHFSVVEEASVSSEDRSTIRGMLADKLSVNVQKLGPKAGDLYAAMLAELDGSPYEPRFDLTRKKVAEMRKDEFGINRIAYLVSPVNENVTLSGKAEYFAKRFDAYVAGLNQLDGIEDDREQEEMDEEEHQERKEKLENESPEPPDDSEESKPSMDEMERLKEGEKAQAIWRIEPARKGYFREKAFDTWDAERKIWTRKDAQYEEFVPVECAVEKENTFTETATIVSGRWTRIPTQLTHAFAGVSDGNSGFRFRRDASGDVSILKESGDSVIVSIVFVEKVGGRKITDAPSTETASDNERFSEETLRVMEEIKRGRRSNKSRAAAIERYVRTRLAYSNESRYNEIYENDPNGYCFAIDTHRQADCDVANTYFAALCRKLGIPVRHVVGHSVPGKEYEKGVTAITSGTGHAWSEIWDEEAREWVRRDATPSGDPNLEDEPQSESDQPSIPGDTGEQEAVGPTDEELRKLAEELAKNVEQLSYTPAERKLAEETGIELKEAREIVWETDKAENTRLPDGRRITDALSQLFTMIVESRKVFLQEYTGPLRRRDGGEHIDDIVRHYVGIVAGESDPVSRAKENDVAKEEKLMSGFDVYLIGDKSGSMSETVDGEAKWEMQRRALYLILSALHRFEEKLKRSGVAAIAGKELDVRTESLSFRGDKEDDLDTDKPLSDRFESVDKVRLWHSLTEQGGGNGDVIALQTIHREISEEIRMAEATGKKSDRLRIVIAMTDGSPDSVTGVHAEAARLGQLGAVVVGIGLTETAKAVKQIYTTEWSQGDYAEHIDDLPAIVARYVILEAMKLFPKKAREQNKQAIATMLREFQSYGKSIKH